MIIFQFQYAGTEAEAQPLVAPFVALKPVTSDNGSVPYPDFADAVGSGDNTSVCQYDGLGHAQFPVGLKVYNISAVRAVYDLHSKLVTEQPAFNETIVQLEGYPLEAMKAVDPASTAYAHRADNLLVYARIHYTIPFGSLHTICYSLLSSDSMIAPSRPFTHPPPPMKRLPSPTATKLALSSSLESPADL